MKTFSIIISLAFVMLFSAFAKAQDSTVVKVEVPKIFVKAYQGKTVTTDIAQVKLVRVMDDSRCPKGVTCVWAGQAKVLIEVTYPNGKKQKREVIVGSSGVSKGTPILGLDGLEIFVRGLQPYPDTNKKIEASDYFLLLDVEN